MQFEDISYNFSVAKVGAILMVATAHYFPGSVLWIPTTVALFVFAFSSGFFTAQKYSGDFSVRAFWRAKVVRIGYKLVAINLFLLSLFVLQHRDGILSWHTLLGLSGLNGFLRWFKIPNQSPFGAGLWFFTLLWLFYFCYPLIDRFNREPFVAAVFVTLSFIGFTSLQFLASIGHALGITAFAFVFGAYSARFRVHIHPAFLLSLIFGATFLMIVLSLKFDTHIFNIFGIMVCSIATVYALLCCRLPEKLLKKLLVLSGCVMEIYFIHTYVFIKTSHLNRAGGYVLSIGLTILIALLLNKMSERLRISLHYSLRKVKLKTG